ncbi:TetR/AcrR family transcriptional regulator [Microbacterium sp. C5A9]|uniref:TetR/AcrR family transcriptional regulator n=1 Tax=Microbacterium sp. C5A9 TaxID=2736663 RepID=UPI0027E2911D|nr:TetR/AcrR family transcriptional regulator [Microbacterium sp. C5A9]MCI1017346.1 TetR/AcrR family transcriptional regulator [Microbacterium sp. C5A9]
MSFPSQYAAPVEKSAPQRDGERTRQRAIQVAAAHISANGFHKMSIAAVAVEAGVSQSGLLHHFPSKAALLSAVLDEQERSDSEFLFGDGEPPLGWDAFDALVALAAHNSTRPQWVQLFVRISAEATAPTHPGHPWIRRHYDSVRSWLVDAVEHGKANGSIQRGAPTRLIVESTAALLDGIQQQWVLAPETVSMVDNVRFHVETLKKSWG